METPFRRPLKLLSPHIPMVSAEHPLILAEVPSCLKVLRLRPERRFCRLGDLSKEATAVMAVTVAAWRVMVHLSPPGPPSPMIQGYPG